MMQTCRSRKDGQWFDLETGLPYNPQHDYRTGRSRTQRIRVSLQARSYAKTFGGKALMGSPKQKEWAENIRAEKLAEMACDPSGLLTHRKFWIEYRHASGKQIGEFVMQQKVLLAQHRSANKRNDGDAVATIATQYNELTEKWGF